MTKTNVVQRLKISQRDSCEAALLIDSSTAVSLINQSAAPRTVERLRNPNEFQLSTDHQE